MVGNFKKIVTGSRSLLLLTLLTLSGARCEDDKDLIHVFMIFEIPVTVQPPSETIKVGDTLWLEGHFPDTLKDIHTGNFYQLKNFDFKSKICINRLLNNQLYLSQQQPAFGEFNYVGGTNQTSSVCGNFLINYLSNSYSYKVGFIPLKTGIFNIFINRPITLDGMPENRIDLESYIDLGYTADGRKRIPVYEAFKFIINNGNTNFDLYQQYCKPGIDVVPSEELGSFTFRVVE
ncbi:MAG: hypothetical protein N2044_09690 [Cyclobacteriaceae bacterium]|nr:hypothetical protein [Cyclobacteriaceae bacterium]